MREEGAETKKNKNKKKNKEKYKEHSWIADK
jgi:hypothetical protein